jgi:peptidyl-tRNA hydrolase, PTH1 family
VWLVVGLGNPGRKYARNRHNIGFHVADCLALRHQLDDWRSKFGGDYATGLVNGSKVAVLKPMEFMNLSGNAVQRAVQFHRLAPEQVIVIHDEIDFPLGRVKAKADGGHGGHNGLRSLIAQLGSKEFARVRVGVGRPTTESGAPVRDDNRVASYVLSDFPAAQAAEVTDMIGRAADLVEAIVRDGVRTAMNDFNGGQPADGGPTNQPT